MDLTTRKRLAMHVVTTRAPSNMAVIKYWGKRDEKLILPLNSSLSVTLSVNEMSAKTSVAISEDFEKDRMWLNGKEEDINNPRVQNCLKEFRKLLSEKEGPRSPLLQRKAHICSENNFPTAAGLASSAAGYACLVYTLAQAYGLKGQELTKIARQGSGSACRSLDGGFVLWNAGEKEDGSDSIAYQVFPHDHWPELRILILVVKDSRKNTSSTGGMLRSTRTSSLLPLRCKMVLPARIQEIQEAIRKKDFHAYAEITMKDSNQFHAICQDTYPPIRYMNDSSWEVVNLVHKFNEYYGTNRLAYTFDAGPNPCLHVLESDVDEVISLVQTVFPPDDATRSSKFVIGLPSKSRELSSELTTALQFSPSPAAVKYIIHTKVGQGPEVVHDHLIDDNGLPISLQ